jgi:hypothetical protein
MGAEVVDADFARELERENARLREALEVAERELVHLFTVLPIGGTLPSPCVMQHIQWPVCLTTRSDSRTHKIS